MPKKSKQARGLANSTGPVFSGFGRLTPAYTAAARLPSPLSDSIARHLVLAYWPGWQSLEDLNTIARLVHALDPRIKTFIVPATQTSSVSRRDAATRPTLIVSPGRLAGFRPRRGLIYQGFPIPKFKQVMRLQAAGVPVPLTAMLRPGLELDPAVWGEFVVVKPTEMTTSSHGLGINLFRTQRVRLTRPDEYPEGHPGRQGPMMVQQYIDTGEKLTTYRVLTLFGEPLYAMLLRSIITRVDLAAPDADIESATIAHQADPDRDRLLVSDADVIALAQAAHKAIPEIPLKGCDIVRDNGTGRLYVLEVNPGGNTWHFSSDSADEMRRRMGPELVLKMRQQFQAFRTAAIALVERTLAEAE